jgi:hypothetical protein
MNPRDTFNNSKQLSPERKRRAQALSEADRIYRSEGKEGLRRWLAQQQREQDGPPNSGAEQ